MDKPDMIGTTTVVGDRSIGREGGFELIEHRDVEPVSDDTRSAGPTDLGTRAEPTHVLALQRRAGNRATNAALAALSPDRHPLVQRMSSAGPDQVVDDTRHIPSAQHAAGPPSSKIRASVTPLGREVSTSPGTEHKIQMMRDPAAVDGTEWEGLRKELRGIYGEMTIPAVKKETEAAYRKSLGKGTTLVAELQETGPGTAAEPGWIADLSTRVRELGYSTVRQEEDLDRPGGQEPSQQVSTGRGKRSPNKDLDYFSQDAYYQTEYDPNEKQLVVNDVERAKDNAENLPAEKEKEKKPRKGIFGKKRKKKRPSTKDAAADRTAPFLNDMLLYQLAAARGAEQQHDPNALGGSLESIRHNTVVNANTLGTEFLTEGGAQAMLKPTAAQVVDDPTSDDFKALIGTQNLESSIRLVLARGNALGIGAISSIQYQDDWIQVNYVAAADTDDAQEVPVMVGASDMKSNTNADY